MNFRIRSLIYDGEKRLTVYLVVALCMVIVCLVIAIVSNTKTIGSQWRYLVRGPVGFKYVYRINNNKMVYAIVASSYEGAGDIARVINEGKDSFNFTTMAIGNHISCASKRKIRDTVRIDGVLFGLIKYSHGKGRMASSGVYYVPDIFLFDSIAGECETTTKLK